MNPLAAAAKDLMALGITGDALVAALNRMEQAVYIDPIKGVDPVAEKRRAYDRDRKRNKVSAETRVESGGIPVESTESADQAEITRPLPSSPPGPPQLPTPTRENITTRTREAANGTRIGEGWTPKANYSISDYGLSDQEHADELSKFRDYWRAVPGAKGRKTDWDATWRNWMRSASETLARRKPYVRTDNSAKFDRHQANLGRAVAGAQIAVRGRTIEPAGGF